MSVSAPLFPELKNRLDSAASENELRATFFEALGHLRVKYAIALAVAPAGDGRLRGALVVQRSPIRHSYEHLIETHPHLIEMIATLAVKGEPVLFDTKSHADIPEDWRNFFREHPFEPDINWCALLPVIREGNLRGVAVYFAEKALAPGALRRLIELTNGGYDKLSAIGALPQASPLTLRQRDVLRLCAEGKSDWEIAHLLGISSATAHEHVETAKHKLEVRTRVQAVAMATRNGWL